MSHVQAFVHDPEDTLREQIMDNLDEMIWSLALPNLTPLYFSAATAEIYQVSCDELIDNGYLWLDMIAVDDRLGMEQAIAQAQETGTSKIIYHIQKRCFSARLKIFKDASGIPIRLDAIAHEISDRHQLQNIYIEKVVLESEQNYRQIVEQRTQALAQSEARNLAILHALPDLLLLLKPDGTCVQCIIPSTDNQSKYLPVQHHISEVLSPEGLATELKLYEKAIATGEVQIYEHQLSKFGKTVYEEVRITPYCEDELLVIVRDITDRKVAEERLVKSDTHLKTAQRIGKLGSWELDLQTGNVVWSEEVFRIFGRDPAIDTPTYAELQNSLHPDDWENFDRTVQNAIAKTQSYDIEYRVYWADGTLVDVLAKGEIICDLEGKPIQLVGTAMDITDRKKTEQQLQNLSDRLTLALKSAAIGVWEWDIAHNCLVWDERTYELYEVIPDPDLDAYTAWVSRIHPSDRASAETAVQLALNGEEDYEPEFRIVLPDGKIRYLQAYALVQRNNAGEPQRLIGINFDITDRKLAEAELNRSRDLRQAIFNESTDALFLVDPQTLLTIDCNRLAVKLFEASNREQLIGIEGHVLQRHQFTNEEIIAINLDLESQGFWSREVEYISRQGRYFWGNLAAKQITVAGSAINLVRVTDISDRKLAEAEILKTARQLENTNRELETFSYSVSHDLRAPLRHMNGFVNALQQRLKNHEALNDPKVIHYLQVIESSSQKMGGLIDGLLTLSRYGRKPLESKQISIRELVDEAIEIISTDPHHNPIAEFAIGDLPTTVGDRILLQQVFSNLIGNAVKFSRNQPRPYIAIDSLPDNTIRIKDNGVGFQMEYADKLFGAFQRLHNEKEFEGTGIGLAIVQRIVQRHGGSIWAEGYPEQGATFFLKI